MHGKKLISYQRNAKETSVREHLTVRRMVTIKKTDYNKVIGEDVENTETIIRVVEM